MLGPRGHWIEIVDTNPDCICRFSRWTGRVHRCPAPGIDPVGYLEAVNGLIANGSFDVLLPTHEQAWLFAVAGRELNPNARIAVASAEAFSRAQSKIEFARLLDELGLPQPKWGLVESRDELAEWRPPFYLKTPFSAAGTGVRRVTKATDFKDAFQSLRLGENRRGCREIPNHFHILDFSGTVVARTSLMRNSTPIYIAPIPRATDKTNNMRRRTMIVLVHSSHDVAKHPVASNLLPCQKAR